MNLKANQPGARDRIIVALDVPDRERALQLVRELRDGVAMFKVGLQLFIAEGPEIVKALREEGAAIFLDLKLHDIPNTVAGAVKSAATLGVEMLTVHLSGGPEMVRAAVEAAPESMSILGVTVLTSTDQATLERCGVRGTIEDQVLGLANLGAVAGVDGLVASPHEVAALRRAIDPGLKIITPGVRPTWSAAGDQKRFMTPRQAFEAGADYLVIGRPITAHANPREALAQILRDLAVSD